jgi:hypothetical protein
VAVAKGLRGDGVRGFSSANGKCGVYGENANGQGVGGRSTSGPGVLGVNGGIDGLGSSSDGVQGFSSANGKCGVYGENANGQGVGGRSIGGPGVLGINGNEQDGSLSDGVKGISFGLQCSGVSGTNSREGYGGSFDGGLAPLRLVPSRSNIPGPPTSGTHQMGELYVDNRGFLFFCTRGADPMNPNDPGTWRQVQLV